MGWSPGGTQAMVPWAAPASTRRSPAKQAFVSWGKALVAMSQSEGALPSRESRTQPPTHQARKPRAL